MTPIADLPSEGLNAAVAAELRAERAAQNLTVQELAERSDVPYASLRRYLSADRHIDMTVLFKLAAALDARPDEIVAAASERLARAGGPVSIPDITHEDDRIVVEADFGGKASPAEPVKRAARKSTEPKKP